MGSEIIYPIMIGCKWGLMVLTCLGLIYVLIFRFRNTSPHWRIALRAILSIVALLLSVPTLVFGLFGLDGFFLALFGQMEPFSDRILMVVFVFMVAVVITGMWWGYAQVVRHFERSLQS